MSSKISPEIQELIDELKGLVKMLQENPKISHWAIRKTLQTIIEKVERRTEEDHVLKE